jgi:CHAT domain-containing protein
MYRLLLPPAATRQLAGKKRLIVCPDGPLWDVPFAALNDGKKFLLERYELAYAYSATGAQATLLARTGKKRTKPTGTLLALANPDFGDGKRFGDNPLIPGQRPVDMPSRPVDMPSRPVDMPSRPVDMPSRPVDMPSRAISMLRGGRIVPLLGTEREAKALRSDFKNAAIYTGEAAQEAVAKREAGKYRYVHLASHAFFNDAAPLLSSILLANPP